MKLCLFMMSMLMITACRREREEAFTSYNQNNPVEVYALFGLQGLREHPDLELDFKEAESIGGVSVLMLAVQNHDLEAVQYLLAKGVDVNARDAENRTALEIAEYFGYQEIVEMLR